MKKTGKIFFWFSLWKNVNREKETFKIKKKRWQEEENWTNLFIYRTLAPKLAAWRFFSAGNTPQCLSGRAWFRIWSERMRLYNRGSRHRLSLLLSVGTVYRCFLSDVDFLHLNQLSCHKTVVGILDFTRWPISARCRRCTTIRLSIFYCLGAKRNFHFYVYEGA